MTEKNTIDQVYESLTDEEKNLLEKINSKLFELIQEEGAQASSDLDKASLDVSDFSQKHPDIIHSKNITGASNELIFTIRAEASHINEHGQLVSINDIVEKFYHIPITLKEDYHPLMEDFFNKFHSTLEATCKIFTNKPNEG